MRARLFFLSGFLALFELILTIFGIKLAFPIHSKLSDLKNSSAPLNAWNTHAWDLWPSLIHAVSFAFYSNLCSAFAAIAVYKLMFCLKHVHTGYIQLKIQIVINFNGHSDWKQHLLQGLWMTYQWFIKHYKVIHNTATLHSTTLKWNHNNNHFIYTTVSVLR